MSKRAITLLLPKLLWRLKKMLLGAPLELRCSTLFSLSLTIMRKGKLLSCSGWGTWAPGCLICPLKSFHTKTGFMKLTNVTVSRDNPDLWYTPLSLCCLTAVISLELRFIYDTPFSANNMLVWHQCSVSTEAMEPKRLSEHLFVYLLYMIFDDWLPRASESWSASDMPHNN